ncbi:hypothetical protein [Deinococcus cellulosilyticus]|nr:hypothetical protein [Deinococcus cellulosilyticus]
MMTLIWVLFLLVVCSLLLMNVRVWEQVFGEFRRAFRPLGRKIKKSR